MAYEDRKAAADVAETVLEGGRNYDFFSLLELLSTLDDEDLEASDSYDAEQRRVRLSVSAGLGFPASDVALAEQTESTWHRYHVQATFFGLHGADSPLPGYYLDRLAYEAGQGVGIRTAFLDYLNHHVLMLLHQAWRKYRYFVRFQPGAVDGFSPYVFALVGLGDADLRGTTPLPWSRLLSFAGLVAMRSRSASMVEGIIAYCFDLDAVHVRECEFRYDELDDVDLVELGWQNGALGQSFVVGQRMRSQHSKFTIAIPNLTRERFYAFLPSGEDFPRLRTLIDFLLRVPIAYDLDLGLRKDQVAPFNLQRQSGTQLGWTSFLGQHTLRPVRIKVRA
ncbi:type VI secretion system baseplate subunit TssG [Burkholderia contaminans]|uniref:type VI secretion system baseplate subunit TssG n=1 Tax=Burkholderia contaminans TaxID=488447 RepID=UPI001CF299FC|nr:type VI secretion system baseplate subunit TssG [Burkholderia contaminans]MCA7918755.1 type VI secretion system baseplate subunit TssG [Burkholderia contaminans]UUX35752.1 type VI secretion system baseplate subunit TssG [Burkholderia contaminans]